MSRGPSARTRQRRNALRILFEMEMNSSTLVEVLEGKRQVGESEQGLFTLELVKGGAHELASDRRGVIRLLQGLGNRANAPGRPKTSCACPSTRYSSWKTYRPAQANRRGGRAREFSTEDSGKFINGLLGMVNRDREEGKLAFRSCGDFGCISNRGKG